MPPKQITLTRAALEKLAERTARQLSKARGETVLCQYWGQPYGLKSNRRYRGEPQDWHVPPGQRHSFTNIAFAFKHGGVDAPWEVKVQQCRHAVANDQATHPEAWSRVTLQELEVLAKDAGEKASNQDIESEAPHSSSLTLLIGWVEGSAEFGSRISV